MYSRREFSDRYGRIPKNYSGNAFREEAPPATAELPMEVPEVHEEPSPQKQDEAVAASLPSNRLFGNGSIGSEELLLLGLILLLSQSEERDDLLLILLVLLLIR